MKERKLKGAKKLLVLGLVVAYMCMAVACTRNNNDNPSGDMAGSPTQGETGATGNTDADIMDGNTTGTNGTNTNNGSTTGTNGTDTNNGITNGTNGTDTTTDNGTNTDNTVNGTDGSLLDDAGNAVSDIVDDAADGVSGITDDIVGDGTTNGTDVNSTTAR